MKEKKTRVVHIRVSEEQYQEWAKHFPPGALSEALRESLSSRVQIQKNEDTCPHNTKPDRFCFKCGVIVRKKEDSQ